MYSKLFYEAADLLSKSFLDKETGVCHAPACDSFGAHTEECIVTRLNRAGYALKLQEDAAGSRSILIDSVKDPVGTLKAARDAVEVSWGCNPAHSASKESAPFDADVCINKHHRVCEVFEDNMWKVASYIGPDGDGAMTHVVRIHSTNSRKIAFPYVKSIRNIQGQAKGPPASTGASSHRLTYKMCPKCKHYVPEDEISDRKGRNPNCKSCQNIESLTSQRDSNYNACHTLSDMVHKLQHPEKDLQLAAHLFDTVRNIRCSRSTIEPKTTADAVDTSNAHMVIAAVSSYYKKKFG